MELKYGKNIVKLPLKENNILKVLNLKKRGIFLNSKDKLKELLKNPIGSISLKKLIFQKRAQKILIIVNDVTRPTPYKVILPSLLSELGEVGINNEDIIFLVATGIHRESSKEELSNIFGEDLISTYKFINHNADSPDLHYLGKLKSGNELWINSIVSKVDFIITTGVIVPHYFAGFSGGRKSVLPGICGRKTIEANHAKMVHPNARAGNLKGNPVHQEMQETAEKVRKLFFIPMENISQAIEHIKDKYGEDFQAYILPYGNTILPQLI